MSIRAKLKQVKLIKENSNVISKDVSNSLSYKCDKLRIERDIEYILSKYYDDGQYENIPIVFPTASADIVKGVLISNGIKFFSIGDGKIIIKGED